MNLADVMDEIAEVARELTKVNVHAHPVGSLTPPAVIVGYPENVAYDQTFGRGIDQYNDLPIWIVTGKVTDKTTRDRLAVWTAGAGPESFKARMEAHQWVSCGTVQVTGVEFTPIDHQGQEFLAASFTATVTGPGEV